MTSDHSRPAAPPLQADFLRVPIAHRALHDIAVGRPENSRSAITAAIDAGYAIEIDLQISADAEAMVFHDHDLKRLTGMPGAIGTKSAQELGKAMLLHGDEGIPTFREVLDLIAGRVPLLVEIKDQDGAMGPKVGALEAATADALRDYGGAVAIMSFNPHSVAEMARLCPDIPRGLTTSGFVPEDWHPLSASVCSHLRGIPDYDRVGASFLSHHWQDLERPRVAELVEKGAALLCWTIRTPEEEQLARRIAANITFEGYAAVIP